jgi:hypothetical protein
MVMLAIVINYYDTVHSSLSIHNLTNLDSDYIKSADIHWNSFIAIIFLAVNKYDSISYRICKYVHDF